MGERRGLRAPPGARAHWRRGNRRGRGVAAGGGAGGSRGSALHNDPGQAPASHGGDGPAGNHGQRLGPGGGQHAPNALPPWRPAGRVAPRRSHTARVAWGGLSGRGRRQACRHPRAVYTQVSCVRHRLRWTTQRQARCGQRLRPTCACVTVTARRGDCGPCDRLPRRWPSGRACCSLLLTCLQATADHDSGGRSSAAVRRRGRGACARPLTSQGP